MPFSAQQTALAFLALCEEYGDFLSNLKLQKLLYYAQGWHLALYDEPLFGEALEAWIHGPVVPSVYFHFKDFGHCPLLVETLDLSRVNPHLAEHVKDVWEAYGGLTAFDLEKLSHQEPPWKVARRGLEPDIPCANPLDLNIMRDFFRELYHEQNKEAQGK